MTAFATILKGQREIEERFMDDLPKIWAGIVVLAIVAVALGGFLYHQVITMGCVGFPCLNN